jgi:PhoPQ-activated pathogenicity-related protein
MWSTVLLFLAAANTCHGQALTNGFDWDDVTALDEYVNDESDMHVFQWHKVTEYRFDNQSCTVHILNVTSHRYIDESWSNRATWWHFMGVAIPDNPTRDFAYMFIDGGGNGDPPGSSGPPGPTDARVRIAYEIAGMTGYFGAFILQIPNGGVRFSNDPDNMSRTEDKFIAWTWKTYIDPDDKYYKNPSILARMPMTKGCTRGLTAISEFIESETGRVVNTFGVGGGSKRGWTAWSVAATDRRVIAVTPMVMSLLNFNDTLQAHYRNLGGWTWVFNDYWELNLTQHFHDDLVTNWDYGLWSYEDMFRYEPRLALIPKLLVSACGDEFFLLTDHPYWWNEMGGEKWLMMNQNAEHSLAPWYEKIGETVGSWLMLLYEEELPYVPQMVWLQGITATGAARILASTDSTPDVIQGWQAHTWRNDTRKDFRLVVGYPPFIHPVVWRDYPVTSLGGNLYEIVLEQDLPGFGGAFIDLIWTRFTGNRLHLTTSVQITPDIYPFPSCYGEACWGELV